MRRPPVWVNFVSLSRLSHKMALPFSCKQRICPSCSSRRAEDISERLIETLPEVPYAT
jgi:hypothetical protein